ncbi:hypothetical protein I7V34_18275 [Bacillus sp. V3]|nr:hypothetical protein I7V34_18275 [Bacillus sp. V3]
MFEKITSKVVVMIALLIVLFQSFSFPIYASATIQPWKGNPWSGQEWKGQDWKGTPWDGKDLQWEGESWEGNPWKGKSTNGNDWEGNGTEGQGTNGQGTNGQSWEGYQWTNAPWYMDPWLNNGWTPNGFEGSPFSGNGTNGDPFSGNGTNGNPFAGNGTNGSAFEGSTTSGNGNDGTSFEGNPTDVKLPMGYEVAKYISNDVIGGQVNLASDFINFDFTKNPEGFRPNGTFFSSLVLNGVKVGLGDKTPWYVNGVADAHDGTLKAIDAVGAVKDYKILKEASQLGDAVDGLRGAAQYSDDVLSKLSKVGSISKLNVATAAIGAGYSAFELGFNGAKAYDVITSDAAGNVKVSAGAEAASNAGDLLMNAGVIAAAFPGGQALGAGLIATGAVVWGASKLTKLVADNWSGVKKFAKHPIKNTSKAIAKGFSKVKGWFS